jgi:hypothetical protein
MSMKQDPRQKLLVVALLVVASCGVAVHWLWSPSKLSTYATLMLVVALLVLMKQAAKWRLFQPSRTLPTSIPQVNSRWTLRTIGKGLVCFLAAFAWGGLIAVGIKLHVIDDVSIAVGWLLLSPAIALIAAGMFLMVRGAFSGST